MREFTVGALNVGQTDLLHDLEREAAALRVRPVGVDVQGLLDLLADAHERVERAHRLLKHDADIAAVDGAQLPARAFEQVPSLKEDLTLHGDEAALDESGQRHGSHGLAGAGLAHQAEPLAARKGEIDAAHGLLAGGVKGDVEIADLKHGSHLPNPR